MASSPYSNEEDSVEMEEEEEEELTSLEEEDSSDDQGGSYANVEESPRLFEGGVHSSALMDGLMMEQQPVYDLSRKHWAQRVENESRGLDQRALDELIMDYFLVKGHKEAANQFRRESGVQPKIDPETIDVRREMRRNLLAGNFAQAIVDLDRFDAGVLTNNFDLRFSLQKQHAIELVRRRHMSQALEYVQKEIGPSMLLVGRGKEEEYLAQIEEVLLLFAFDKPENVLSSGQHSVLFDAHARMVLADDVNHAILETLNQRASSEVSDMVKNTIMTQARLVNSGLKFPGKYAGTTVDRQAGTKA